MIIETVGFNDVFLFYSRRCISSLSATGGGQYFAIFDNNKKAVDDKDKEFNYLTKIVLMYCISLPVFSTLVRL
jgi:hypothetical protein